VEQLPLGLASPTECTEVNRVCVVCDTWQKKVKQRDPSWIILV
jgi:hypothetical protein